jgi:CheY-like chemotaxis protein
MPYTHLSVLYVEDDPSSRNMLDVLLRRVMKCPNVTIFEDSSDFLNRIATLPTLPDIILLDIHVGPTNGIDLMRLLRTDPRYNKVKIIALTASVTSSEVNDLQKVGFDGLIGKPVKQAVFPQLIDRIIAGDPVWMVP